MKKLMLSALCCASLVALLPETGYAHGGTYRGPGDTVPPSPGGGGGRTGGGPSGPTTGGPGGPSAPGPSGPTTGGPPGPGGSGPTTGGGAPAAATTGGPRGQQVGPDLTTWEFWWEFNKEPYIALRAAVLSGDEATGAEDEYFAGSTNRPDDRSSLRPTNEQIHGEILPALKKAIDSTEQRDITSSCMVAMAKIGADHRDFTLRSVFAPRLKRGDQEIRETAALAFGIAAIAGEEEMELLTGLALDKGRGRDAYGGEVDIRTRSFSLYGLGLVAHKNTDLAIKRKAFEAMRTVLEDDKITERNLKVAAINGMSILNIPTSTEADKALMDEVLKSLETYFMKPLGAGEALIQSHVPTSIAKLIGRDHKESDRFKELFATELQGKGKVKRSGNEVSESCALALGKMCKPYQDADDKANPDNKYSKLLLETWEKHIDKQTQFFAMVSLGMIGGELNKKAILIALDNGKNQEKPWAALAIGLYSYWKGKDGQGGDTDPFIGQSLMKELKDAKDPSLVGALGIALGLTKTTAAAEEMRKQMIRGVAKEEMAGYLAVGLALMNNLESKEAIREVIRESSRRLTLLQQAAIALGKLGDKRVADDLTKMLTDSSDNNLAKLSAVASAIGRIGDSRTVMPLKRMLFDKTNLTDLSRAFAAVALGGVADKEMVPWNAKIGVDNNYRASVETLTNQQSGILDIL
jgi:hypothetical protein